MDIPTAIRCGITCLSLLLIAFACNGAARAQTLKSDYQLLGNLNSSVAGAPALANLAGSGAANAFVNDTVDGYPRQTLRFSQNGGVSVNTGGRYSERLLYQDALTHCIFGNRLPNNILGFFQAFFKIAKYFSRLTRSD